MEETRTQYLERRVLELEKENRLLRKQARAISQLLDVMCNIHYSLKKQIQGVKQLLTSVAMDK